MVTMSRPGASSCQHQARAHGRAVHQHRAGAAVAVAAAFLGAGQAQAVAQQLEQGVARVGEHLALLAVDGAGEQRLHGHRDLDAQLPAAIAERARRQHGNERTAIVGGAARIRDGARVRRGEPAGLFEQRCWVARPRASLRRTARAVASARRTPARCEPRRRRRCVEADPDAGPGNGDIHLSPRGEAQIFGSGSRRRRGQNDRDEQLAGVEVCLPRPLEELMQRQLAPLVPAGDYGSCLAAQERRNRVRRRRRIADVPAKARTVLHLHAADQTYGLRHAGKPSRHNGIAGYIVALAAAPIATAPSVSSVIVVSSGIR